MNQKETVILQTACGPVRGLQVQNHLEFRGIRYGTAGRFEYAKPVTSWDGIYDATENGDVCTQKRVWYEHLENPERAFYYREFREGETFHYSEDCLCLNIFTPTDRAVHPVFVFIHGGGFDSGSCYDSAIDGASLAEKGLVTVSIQYRVGVFGYFTNEAIQEKYSHDGNFGLNDQYTALRWIRDNIDRFGGDPSNITVSGQSAGAISIQYLCLSEKCRGLFQHVHLMSGGGLFPKFSLPRKAENTHEYWEDVMQTAGASSFQEFQTMDAKRIFDALEEVKSRRKDNIYNTMPVIDGDLLTGPVDERIRHPLPVDTMIGYTNNDMFAVVMAAINHRYAEQTNGFLYCFDINAPGDKNAAFHSSDIRYVFGTLDRSWRPYTAEDQEVSDLIQDYLVSFASTGDPNHAGAPRWDRGGKKALRIVKKGRQRIRMRRRPFFRLLWNTLTRGKLK